MRLDKYLFEKALSKSRTHAGQLISSGFVNVNGRVITKPSFDVTENDSVSVEGEICPYVSRGGLKLKRALDVFGIDVHGCVALDIGASTGGFTDVLLSHGAAKVFAVDSGHGQLAEKLISDQRVISMEGVNARNLRRDDLGEQADICVCDVSFISQTLIHEAVFDCLCDGGIFVGLVKPQFECGRSALSKGGIVKDQRYRILSSEKVWESLEERGFGIFGFEISPISGGDGNTEYLIYARKNHRENTLQKDYIRRAVLEKHSDSSKK